MERKYIALLSLTVVMTCAVTLHAWAQDVFPVIVLKERNGSLTFEKIDVPTGTGLFLDDPSVISVILPLSEGKSANLVRSTDRTGSISLYNREGGIALEFKDDGEETRSYPSVSQEILKTYRIRVNVTGGNGYRSAFRIDRYSEIYETDGPVIDLFGGMIPMQAGDYSITLETEVIPTKKPIHGMVDFIKLGDWLVVEGILTDGTRKKFIWDTGASGVLVLREDALPVGAGISPVMAVSYSVDEVKEEKGKVDGATGSVGPDNFLGMATLDKLTLGTMEFSNLDVNVMKIFPAFLDSLGISGIIGSEVMQQGGVVRITGLNDAVGTIELLGSPTCIAEHGLKLPFVLVGGLLFTRGSIGGVETDFILDTGARRSMLGDQFIRLNDIAYIPVEETSISGISGIRQKAVKAVVLEVTIGGQRFRDVHFTIADRLAITNTLGLDRSGAILGMSFFSSYNSCCIAYAAGVMTLGE